MSAAALPPEFAGALARLADGIIPPDRRDAGAGEVQAGERLAARVAAGIQRALYEQGVTAARTLARQSFACELSALDSSQLDGLLDALRGECPAFYKQLRLDVSALYLSEPAVWRRIGFPGPSNAEGGYPDFDQPPAL